MTIAELREKFRKQVLDASDSKGALPEIILNYIRDCETLGQLFRTGPPPGELPSYLGLMATIVSLIQLATDAPLEDVYRELNS